MRKVNLFKTDIKIVDEITEKLIKDNTKSNYDIGVYTWDKEKHIQAWTY